VPPYEGAKCPGCGELYLGLPTHLLDCRPERVKVWIFGPQYECPGHYNWSSGPLSEATFGNYDKNRYLILLDQYERWQEIQDAWEQMMEEMHKLTGLI
jgi:hypothetical protein